MTRLCQRPNMNFSRNGYTLTSLNAVLRPINDGSQARNVHSAGNIIDNNITSFITVIRRDLYRFISVFVQYRLFKIQNTAFSTIAQNRGNKGEHR